MSEIIRDLGDGLILRRATVADADKLAEHNADLLRDVGMDEPDEGVAVWTRDLMERDHPTLDVGDFTIVEDTLHGSIVSSLCLISQTWAYDGIPFGVGRPELVSTHPDYRRRGLVRSQLQVVHEWSAQRGELVQAIFGIPWYYRQFGYEMALAMGGGRAGYGSDVPKLKRDQTEPLRLRQAGESDLPFIMQAYQQGASRFMVACVRDEAQWRYELVGRSDRHVERREVRVVETREGEPVGLVVHLAQLWRGKSAATVYELKTGASWLTVTPSVIRYLWATGHEYAARDAKQALSGFAFYLGTDHPVYQVFRNRLPHRASPYAWYLRVSDLPGFLRHITPALERRLAGSAMAGYSGELTVSFYRDGLRLVFANGTLTGIEAWQPTPEKWGDASFPDRTFLQVVFGYRSLDELKYAFADCRTEGDKAPALLEALFPKSPSHVWAVS